MSVSPKAKRKKEMTRKEVMEKLKQNENDIIKAVQGLLEELCPFDVNDEEALKIEGRLERLQKASHIFECKLWRLKKQIKERKFCGQGQYANFAEEPYSVTACIIG